MEITLSACTYADWEAIIKKAVYQAKRGNPQARKFLADYLLGPPPQRLEHTGAGGGPLTMRITDEEYARTMATFNGALKRLGGGPDNSGADVVGATE